MKYRGFSLIELLIVISTIAVLLAIMVPSMSNTKQHAKAVLCQSNLRELTTSLLMYELENETFPNGWKFSYTPPEGGFLGTQKDKIGLWWINYISKFISIDKKKVIFKCPSQNITDKTLDPILCGNYGVNESICKSSSDRRNWDEFVGKPLSFKKVTNASKTLLIADSGYALITWRHVSDKDIEGLGMKYGEDIAYIPGLKINIDRIDNKSLSEGQEDDALKGRHPGKTVNVGFLDGHVETKKADDLLIQKTETDYKNRRPLWLPD
jgi:prepilin-type processing-associated H-X9-DG protein/prepilin-type N-terminal cleavage/methylation domain-containing protein